MSSRRSRCGAVLASAGLALASVPAAALAASSSGDAVRQLPDKLTARYDIGVRPHLRGPAGAAGASIAGSIQNFTASVTDHGRTFSYSMVGKNPTVRQASPAATVKTVVVPLIIKIGTFTWDPTKGDTCDATSAVTRLGSSPIFVNKAYSFGGTSVGTTQYVDAYQRANFWAYAKPGAVNPGYHVLLARTTLPARTINVPTSSAATGSTGCGNRKLGAIEINWLDNYLQRTLIPALHAQGVDSTTFPLFVTENVVQYVTTTSQCCVLGFHNAFNSAASGGKVQTYGIAMYDNTGDFTGSRDISVATHEVGEWMDDPFVNNPTKPWGHIGQVTACQSNLEIGDPLSGTIKAVTVGSKAYHVQELAFLSWFYHQSPSIGINGWYSNYGKFRTAAAPCP